MTGFTQSRRKALPVATAKTERVTNSIEQGIINCRLGYAIRKRGGRKLVITPDGTTTAPMTRARVDIALLKALARGFRWRKLLEIGDFSTIQEIAAAENINPSYVSRVIRMTLLAPEIVEAILAGKQPQGLTMGKAMQPFPWQWQRQEFS